MDMNYEKLSKEISYALRHAPWEYELELDENGWVEIDSLVEALNRNGQWENLNKKYILDMINQSDKKRHEVLGNKIRALYGHSTPIKIEKDPKKPPDNLYHGTARKYLKSIQENGLSPKERHYVHLSPDLDTALEVGKRRDHKPILLKVNALMAWNEGVKFYKGNEKIWLADFVDYKYIECFNPGKESGSCNVSDKPCP